MKLGRSLTDLATEIDRQAKSKKDYIADTRALRMKVVDSNALVLQGINGSIGIKPLAHQQIATTLGVPKPYYDRMLAEAPDLLTTNVNRWFVQNPLKRLVRTLDGDARAFLSNSYRPLDNYDLAKVVIPQFEKLGAKIESCELTDRRLYLKAVTDKIEGQVKVGDKIRAGVVVSNSEVGQGFLEISAYDFRLSCLNGMVREHVVRKAHVGRRNRNEDVLEEAREFFRDETRQADDRAFFLKVEDAVKYLFDQDLFNKRLDQYRDAAERQITADPIEVVEVTAKQLLLNEDEKSNVLQHLIRGGDLSKWGLANAVTRASQDVVDYDRATEMEGMGATVVELSNSVWDKYATRN